MPDRAAPDAPMTVARWEFYSLAVMLIGVHGDGAEEEAARKLEQATERDDRGEMVVWREVAGQLVKIRAERAQSDA